MLTYLVLAFFLFVCLRGRGGRNLFYSGSGAANLKLTVGSVFHNAKDGADISSDSGATEL